MHPNILVVSRLVEVNVTWTYKLIYWNKIRMTVTVDVILRYTFVKPYMLLF